MHGDTEVYIDNVFFQSEHLKFGNPSLNQQEARTERANQPNNYLIEKPQYAVSYNDSLKTPNWASYKLDPSWLAPLGKERKGFFDRDWSLPFDGTISQDYGNEGEKGTIAIRGHLVPNQDRGREGRPVTGIYQFLSGTVVNSKIVQRRGTFFPNAGGIFNKNRDLPMTASDAFYPIKLNSLTLANFLTLK